MEEKIRQLLELIKEYVKMKQIYLSCYELLAILRDDLRAGKYKLEDMVNFIYVMREISRLANDLRKETDGISHMFENMACMLYTVANKTDPIRASLATGSPDVKLAVKIPNREREPEKFYALMNFFDVASDALEKKVTKPHWPGICEQVSIMAEEGKPLPPGIDPDDTYPTYRVTIRGLQDIDELIESIDSLHGIKVSKRVSRKEVKALNKLLTTRQKRS